MNLAAKFDALRSFFAIVPENKLKVIANKASIIDVLIGIMAGGGDLKASLNYNWADDFDHVGVYMQAMIIRSVS